MKNCSKCNQLKTESEFWKDKRLNSGLRTYCKNCERISNYDRVKKYRLLHPDRRRESSHKTDFKKLNTIKGKINNSIKSNIYHSLKGNKNGRNWENLVGYTLNQLIKHLKKTLPIGYSWDDYFSGKLHIDHIIPISAFNFKKPEDIDFKKCWALSNLQLLSKEQNQKKYNKLIRSFQPAFSF